MSTRMQPPMAEGDSSLGGMGKNILAVVFSCSQDLPRQDLRSNALQVSVVPFNAAMRVSSAEPSARPGEPFVGVRM